MSGSSVVLTLAKRRKTAKVDGLRVAFSPYRCFAFYNGADDLRCLRALATYLQYQPGLALFGSGRFLDYLLAHVPELGASAVCVIPNETSDGSLPEKIGDLPVKNMATLPAEVQTIFVCELLAFPRLEMRQQVPAHLRVIDATILAEIAR